MLSLEAFSKGLKGLQRFHPAKRIYCNLWFSKPSTGEIYVLDLDNQRLLLSSLVAHGRNSGLDRAVRFSIIRVKTSQVLAFYRIGGFIHSPKHGQRCYSTALKISEWQCRSGQNYYSWRRLCLVSNLFVHMDIWEEVLVARRYPTRSWKMCPVLANGSLLYIYAGPDKTHNFFTGPRFRAYIFSPAGKVPKTGSLRMKAFMQTEILT